jgi:integrase
VPGFVEKLRKSSASDVVKLALEFLILTAARTGEVLGATWEEIDLDAAQWTMPGERMKAGRNHRVAVSDRAVSILKAAKKLGGKTYVFPTAGKDAPLSNMALAMVLRRMGYRVTVHGFRSAFRVWSAERTSFPREVCEAALAHTIKGVEGDYQRSDLFDRRRELMRTWDSHVCSASAKVVKIRAA